jgi:hypothetical protein
MNEDRLAYRFGSLVASLVLVACAGGGDTHAGQVEPPVGEPRRETAPGREDREEVGHAFVRGQGGVHGEVALYRSNETRIVETLLYSRVLKRVVAEIAVREADAWPEGSPGAEDSSAYVEALERAQKKVWWESARDPAQRDRVQEMAISFEAGRTEARVSLFAVTTGPGPGQRRQVADRRLLEVVPVSLEYAIRDQRLIVEDAFGVDSQKAAALLGGAENP